MKRVDILITKLLIIIDGFCNDINSVFFSQPNTNMCENNPIETVNNPMPLYKRTFVVNLILKPSNAFYCRNIFMKCIRLKCLY